MDNPAALCYDGRRIEAGGETMTLGERLIQLRAKAGLSQDTLAEQLGVSRQSVSQVGKRRQRTGFGEAGETKWSVRRISG